MLRIVITDDEERIRQGLAKMITSAGEDYRIVGLFASGPELLERLDELEFDLLITDIKMPAMNGIRLVELLHERRPELRAAIVSGFSDFEYARQAIRLGAVDYLIKPIDKEELYRLLAKLRLELADARRRDRDRLREALRAALAQGAEGPARQRLAALLPAQPLSYGCAVIRSEAPLAALPELDLAAFQADFLELAALTTHELCVVYGLEARHPQERLVPLGRLLAERVMDALPGTLAAGIAVGATGADDWPACCREAQRASRRALYSPARTDIAVAAETAEKSMLADVHARIDKELRQEAQVLDATKLLGSLRELFRDLALLQPELDDIAACCDKIVYMLQREIAEFPAALARRYDEGDWLAELKLGLRLRTIEARFASMIQELLADVREERERSGSRVIEKVKRMIEEEYNRDIELGRLAERVFLTPSYLSKLFKSETGETLTDYLIGIRMSRAKQLLKEHAEMKTYEVGERVGYSDPAYFNKIFKKMVGVTPKEFKDQAR
ncbi:response regulator [Paenibacillus athensensis]|uniref:Response regulator n=1 Tax=Paenibacillus athensensis TaxID=1967502 RepID=A0A4Y8Q9I3_9BACL|nr:response regulator [Paenibacillus athensensis]MCD1258960.1 response regulator [Paenibacillus athensensis]